MSKLSARKKRVKQTVKVGNVASKTVAEIEDLDARMERCEPMEVSRQLHGQRLHRGERDRALQPLVLAAEASLKRVYPLLQLGAHVQELAPGVRQVPGGARPVKEANPVALLQAVDASV